MGRPKNSKNKPKFGYLTLEQLAEKLQGSAIQIPVKIDFLNALHIPHITESIEDEDSGIENKTNIIEFSITPPA